MTGIDWYHLHLLVLLSEATIGWPSIIMNSAEGAVLDEKHLDWSAKQGRILTDRGNALRYYSEKNGFPFSPVVSSVVV